MNKSKILRAVLTAVLTLVATTASYAYDFEVGSIYYNKNGDGTVSVTFKGSYSDSYVDEYTGDVVIPSSVTYSETTYSVNSIGDRAFSGCSGLTSVTIPNSVTSIGTAAFAFCSGLESIVVESGNSKYDSRDNCNAIIETATNTLLAGCKNTTIPNSVTSIGENAFWGCSGLTSVSIPNSVTSIGENAFSGCKGLNSVTIPNSVSSILPYAFAGCGGLTSVNIPNCVIFIGWGAFSGCNFKSIFYNAEYCDDVLFTWAFDCPGNNNLIINIGKDVRKLPDNLFYGLNEQQRIISHSVTPPTCNTNTFNSEAYSAKLYVPSEGVFGYQFADVWSKFSSINGLDKPITGITLSESDVTLKVNETKTITASITPADATIPDAYYWTSSNSNVATVNDDGVVTAVAGGTAVISANSCDGGDVVATCNVTVKSNKATSISLSATELKIAKNGTATLTYTILPEDAEVKTAEWTVSDASILIYRVNDDGSILIGGKSEGTATVTARTTDSSNLEATCVVSVGAGAVEGVDTAAARIYTAAGCIIIAATEDGEATVYDFTGRLIKSVPVASGDSIAVPVAPGYYIVKTGTKTQSVVVK